MRVAQLVLLLTAICGCSENKSQRDNLSSNPVGSEAEQKQEEDFYSFYRKFNQDSIFQNSRIIAVGVRKGHIDTYNLDTTVFRVMTKFYPGGVKERIIFKKDTSYYVEYFFEKRDGKWVVARYYDSYFE